MRYPMKYQVIISTDLQDRPKDQELSAALILAEYFKSDVIFLRPQKDKTPDIDIGGVHWEIKSPKGDGKKTIENNDLQTQQLHFRFYFLTITQPFVCHPPI